MIPCPHCRRDIDNSDADLAGCTVACPSCGGQFVLPGAAPHVMAAPVVSRRPAASREKRLDTTLLAWLLAGNLLANTVTMGALIAWEVRYHEHKQQTRQAMEQLEKAFGESRLDEAIRKLKK